MTEDRIPEKISSFEEGGAPGGVVRRRGAGEPEAALRARHTGAPGCSDAQQRGGRIRPCRRGRTGGFATGGGECVCAVRHQRLYVPGFVFAQDAIAGFVRSMEEANKIAFYSYSRNLSRATPLTTDRTQVMRGVRNTVAGDEAALYNSLLLTVRDAAQLRDARRLWCFPMGRTTRARCRRRMWRNWHSRRGRSFTSSARGRRTMNRFRARCSNA